MEESTKHPQVFLQVISAGQPVPKEKGHIISAPPRHVSESATAPSHAVRATLTQNWNCDPRWPRTSPAGKACRRFATLVVTGAYKGPIHERMYYEHFSKSLCIGTKWNIGLGSNLRTLMYYTNRLPLNNPSQCIHIVNNLSNIENSPRCCRW